MASNVSKLSVMGALLLSAVVCSSAYDGYLAMSSKAIAQQQALTKFNEWSAEFAKLKPIEDEWNAAIHKYSKVNVDVKHIYAVLNTPEIMPDSLQAGKLDPFISSQGDVNADKSCLNNKSSQGIEISNSNFKDIFVTLNSLLKRPDLSVKSISFVIKEDKPLATLNYPCIIMRKDGPDSSPLSQTPPPL